MIKAPKMVRLGIFQKAYGVVKNMRERAQVVAAEEARSRDAIESLLFGDDINDKPILEVVAGRRAFAVAQTVEQVYMNTPELNPAVFDKKQNGRPKTSLSKFTYVYSEDGSPKYVRYL